MNTLFWSRTIRLLIPYMILAIIHNLFYVNLIDNKNIDLYNWTIDDFYYKF